MDRLDRAFDRLFALTDYERITPRGPDAPARTLDAMRGLCAALDGPEGAFATVHLAGTKGKGSTAEMVAALLGAVPGTRAGLYTSPHLVDLRERIRIDGELVGRSALADALEPVLDLAPRILETTGSRPTFFDAMTTAAFLAFRAAGVTHAVIECGLGGRLDSTNVVRPEVAAITSVSLDHVQVLGHDLAGIAREKAGIVEAGALFYASLPDDPRVLEAVEEACAEAGVRLRLFGRDLAITPATDGSFDLRFEDGSTLESVEVGPPGPHQRRNAALALAIVRGLSERPAGVPFDPAVARGALRRLTIPARGEWFEGRPRVLLDGAHNVASARALRSILDEASIVRRRFVLSIAEDKDWRGFLAELVRADDEVIATRTDNPRVLDPARLAEEASRRGARARVVESAAAALEESLQESGGARRDGAKKEDGHGDEGGDRGSPVVVVPVVVVVTGSLYLAGALRTRLLVRSRGDDTLRSDGSHSSERE